MTESAGGTNAVPATVEVVVVVVVVVVTAPASGIVATVVSVVFLQAAAPKTSAPARAAVRTMSDFLFVISSTSCARPDKGASAMPPGQGRRPDGTCSATETCPKSIGPGVPGRCHRLGPRCPL